MKTKEVKLIIKSDTDPEILKWANSLKYGVFPKVMIEILRWYDNNGLLVRGGVNQPDLLPPKIPLNQDTIEVEKLNQIIKLISENNQLIRSGKAISPTEKAELDNSISSHDSLGEVSSPMQLDNSISNHNSLGVGVSPKQDEVDIEEVEHEQPVPAFPPAFKIYR